MEECCNYNCKIKPIPHISEITAIFGKETHSNYFDKTFCSVQKSKQTFSLKLKLIDPRDLRVSLWIIDINVVDETQLDRIEENQKQYKAFKNWTFNAPDAILSKAVTDHEKIK